MGNILRKSSGRIAPISGSVVDGLDAMIMFGPVRSHPTAGTWSTLQRTREDR